MLYRALSLSFLLSSLIHASDQKEFDVVTTVKPVKMPIVGSLPVSETKPLAQPASNAGGSIINLVAAVTQPSAKELARDREIQLATQKLDADIREGEIMKGNVYGGNVRAQLAGPDQKSTGMAFDSKETVVVECAPRAFSKPTTAAAISTPSVATSTPIAAPSTNMLQLPTPPKATPIQMPSIPVQKGVQPLSPINEMMAPKSYIKPLPTPQPVESAPLPDLIPNSPDSFDWGKLAQDAGEGAVIAVTAMAAGYVAYKTGEGLYKGSKWLWKKAFGEAEKQVVQQAMPKSVHANLEFHQNSGHCETPPKTKKKPGCLRAEVQPGDPRTQGLADIEFPTDATHIFRDQWGHLVHDTPETRNLLRECYKKGTYHGFDGAGNHQFSMTNPKDGSQLWLKIREGGKISTAGCNEIHLPISKETGFLFKPDCWKNPSAKGVGCTFIGGTLAGMSSQVSKAGIPEAVLFPVDKDPKGYDLPFCDQSYKTRFSPPMIQFHPIPEAPEGYSFESVKNEGLLLPPPPKAVTIEEVKAERASKMTYAIRMKKKNMEDYMVMEEMRKRNKQQAKVLKDAFFKKDSL